MRSGIFMLLSLHHSVWSCQELSWVGDVQEITWTMDISWCLAMAVSIKCALGYGKIYIQSAVASCSFVPTLDFSNRAHQGFTMINKLHDEWGGSFADLWYGGHSQALEHDFGSPWAWSYLILGRSQVLEILEYDLGLQLSSCIELGFWKTWKRRRENALWTHLCTECFWVCLNMYEVNASYVLSFCGGWQWFWWHFWHWPFYSITQKQCADHPWASKDRFAKHPRRLFGCILHASGQLVERIILSQSGVDVIQVKN